MLSMRRVISVLPVLSAGAHRSIASTVPIADVLCVLTGLTYVAAASFPFALNARSIMNRQATLDPSDIPAEVRVSPSTCFPSNTYLPHLHAVPKRMQHFRRS